MKKNELTEKHNEKGSKGFYAALGISAVMIGAACLFAHKQGDRLPQIDSYTRSNSVVQENTVSRQVTNIQVTTAPANITKTTATAPLITEAPLQTLPAAEIKVDAPFKDNVYIEQAELAATDMSEVRSPLEDMSNIICEFSNGELVKNSTTGTWQTHNGTDIAAEVGTDVYAVAAGEIESVSNDPLWGVTIVINHMNGYITKYCGMGSDLAIKKGDRVDGGDILGAVGETADIESSIPPHLHFEVTHNGKFIDPMSLISN